MTLLECAEMARSPRLPGKPPALPVEEPDDDAVSLELSSLRESEPNYQHFSRALRARRKELDLTQVQLAVKAGVALGTVHLIEASRQNPMLRSLVTLAEAVDLKIGDLLPQSIPPGEGALISRFAEILEKEQQEAQRTLDLAKERLDRLTDLLSLLREGRRF